MPYRRYLLLPIVWLLCEAMEIRRCTAQPPATPWTRLQADRLDFELADGLEIELAASEPLTRWPMLADWDDAGRLVVVESGGVASPIEEHNKQLLHRIVRLVDEDGDGQFDRRILAADKLPFTEGVLCLGDTILAAAPPVIWKLVDSDGDGYCEQREVWFDGQTITGCANDLHGPYLGRDGWIYWSKGAFAPQIHKLTDGTLSSDRAAHIYRRHWAGGPIEPVMSGGMDNPVGFTMLSNGERFFSSTFLVHPGDGQRDGVVHAIYGGAYGKDHSALAGVPRTGPLMPLMTHLGPAAPSGMICLRSSGLMTTDSDHDSDSADATLVVALFNLQKVVALPLTKHGATYLTQPIHLVVGSRIDFHPTDVIEDFDGSMLVIDTGGWYNLCCPSSRVDQQTASGGIYRLRRKNAPPNPTRSIPVAWDDLSAEQVADLLDDPRPWVARSALLKIASSGDWATSALAARTMNEQLSVPARQNSLWALGAIGSEEALKVAHTILLKSPQMDDGLPIQQIACHLISLHRYRPAQDALEQVLTVLESTRASKGSDDAELSSDLLQLARVVAEALGRMGDEHSVRTLMGQCDLYTKDRILDHSIRYALYEMRKEDAVAEFLSSDHLKQRELALATLDLLKSEAYLTADALIRAAAEPETAPTAIRLLAQRPQLASSVLDKLGPVWAKEIVDQPPSELFVELAEHWRDTPEMRQWIAKLLDQPQAIANWSWIEPVLNASHGSPLPESWTSWILASWTADQSTMARLLAGANLGTNNRSSLIQNLIDRIEHQTDPEAKAMLIRCLPPRHLYPDDELAGRLVESARTNSPTADTWNLLRRLKISSKVAQNLINVSRDFGTSDLLNAVEVVASVENDSLDLQMLADISDRKSARGLPSGSLVNVYRQRSEPVRLAAQEVADQLARSESDVTTSVRSLLDQLPEGNAVDGLTLFHGTRANCGACHQMGYVGGKIGPELTRIGGSRTREALLEAILFPSERIEQGFQSTQALTVDGRVVHGLVTHQSTDQVLELRVSADKIERIPVEEIEQTQASNVSIMPGGMMELLTHQELADLLSLLEAAR